MSFSSRLKERRKKLGLTQIQFAAKLGVSNGAVGAFETGRISMKAETLYKACEILKCDPNYLFQDDVDIMNVRLSEDEKKLIKAFRSLNNDGKRYVFQSVSLALKTNKK